MRSGKDAKRGLYGKFRVTRSDGSSGAGGRHERCKYFVLDLTHDQFAKAALSPPTRWPAGMSSPRSRVTFRLSCMATGRRSERYVHDPDAA
jgi:hypothetical protein